MRESSRVSQVIDRHEIEVGDFLLLCGAQHLPADAAESIDSNAYCHSRSFLCYGGSRSPAAAARPKVT